MRETNYYFSVEVMRFEILLSLDKLQYADVEFDSKAFQIKMHHNFSSAAILQEAELVHCRLLLHRTYSQKRANIPPFSVSKGTYDCSTKNCIQQICKFLCILRSEF